jgi:hypothetical protein
VMWAKPGQGGARRLCRVFKGQGSPRLVLRAAAHRGP